MISYKLTTLEKGRLLFLGSNLLGNNYNFSTEQIVKLCALNKTRIIEELQSLSNFIQSKLINNSKNGYLIIQNLPSFNETPILTVILGFLLGTVIKEYDGGGWVKEIKSDPTLDHIISAPSSKDRKEFLLHTDLSYIAEPPPFFVFHCLKNPQNTGGMTTLCFLGNILNNISSKAFLELQLKQYNFVAPSYHVDTGRIIQSILTTEPNDRITIRFRRDGITAQTRSGIEAIYELVNLMQQQMEVISFDENTAMYINNHRCLHGRFSFLNPVVEHQYRHFRQVYVCQ